MKEWPTRPTGPMHQKRSWTALLASCVIVLCFFALFRHPATSGAPAIERETVKGADSDGLEALMGPRTVPKESGFTIIATPYKRPQSLPAFVANYANGTIPSLRRIILSWGDATSDPDPKFLDSLKAYPVPVIIERPKQDSLNMRFWRSENITTDCILSLDDDIAMDPVEVEFGYQTWKEFGQGRKRMVGFVARGIKGVGDDLSYTLGRLRSFSMVLSKMAFYHVDWMNLYWSSNATMTDLRAFIDKNHNCEDLLMSYLHARHTGVAPIFIKSSWKDVGLVKGISSSGFHHVVRRSCLHHFRDVLGIEALPTNTMLIKNMAVQGAEDTGVDW